MTHVSDPPPDPKARPTWRPPRDRDGNVSAIVVGLVLLAIGIWYFLERTLGLQMPRIDWGAIWPVILIILGAVVLIRSGARRD